MNWPTVKLGEVCEIITKGTTPTTLGLHLVEDGIPFLRVLNIQDGDVTLNNTLFIDSNTDEVLKRSRIKPNDILISIAGTIGRCALISQNAPAMNCNQAVAIVRLKDGEVQHRFLLHWLSTEQAQGAMSGAQVTGTIANLSLGQVSKLEIPLPPLSEQKRLAAILDRADTTRRLRRESLARLDELAQSLFLELFGDLTQFKNVSFGDLVSSNRIGLVRSAKEVGPQHSVPYVRMNAITRSGELDLTNVFKTSASKQELIDYSLKNGDFLFNTRNSRELVGKTALFQGAGAYIYNNNILRTRFKDSIVPTYIAAAFKTPRIQQELETRKSGTTNVFAVYYKDLATIQIPLPPLELQQKFAEQIAELEAIKVRARASLTELDALFASLQARAFAGELSSAA